MSDKSERFVDEEFDIGAQLEHGENEGLRAEREEEIDAVLGRKGRLFADDKDVRDVAATIVFKDGTSRELTVYELLALGNAVAVMVGGLLSAPEILLSIPTGDRVFQLLNWNQDGPSAQRMSGLESDLFQKNAVQVTKLATTLMEKL
jgi:hypothetical protein